MFRVVGVAVQAVVVVQVNITNMTCSCHPIFVLHGATSVSLSHTIRFYGVCLFVYVLRLFVRYRFVNRAHKTTIVANKKARNLVIIIVIVPVMVPKPMVCAVQILVLRKAVVSALVRMHGLLVVLAAVALVAVEANKRGR